MSNDRKSLDALINRLQYLSYSLGISCGKTGRTLESTDLSNKVEAVRKELEAALSRPAEGDGWKLVPVEPTPMMIDAGLEAMSSGDAPEDEVGWVYDAMLKAAPPPPTAGSGEKG